MPDPRYQQEMQRAERRVGSPGAGMGGSRVSPPPQGAPQQPAAGGQQAPGGGGNVTPGFEQLLERVEDILVQGKPGDLDAFGKFIGRLQELVQGRQGAGAQAPGAPPQGAPGGQPPPQRPAGGQPGAQPPPRR